MATKNVTETVEVVQADVPPTTKQVGIKLSKEVFDFIEERRWHYRNSMSKMGAQILSEWVTAERERMKTETGI